MNHYIYLPFTSDHPPMSKKSFITGELKRYVRLCSSFTNYLEVRNLFFQRLRKRGYTSKFLRDQFIRVKYQQRDQLLTRVHKEKKIPLIFQSNWDPFSRTLDIKNILKSHWSTLKGVMDDIVDKPLIIYKKGKSLQDLLTRATLPSIPNPPG